MEFSSNYKGLEPGIEYLFKSTFTDSEGSEEGALIGGLARNLLSDTAPDDIHVFLAREGESVSAF